LRPVAFPRECPAVDGTEHPEDAGQQREPAHHQLLLGEDAATRARRLRHGRLRGPIAGAEVLRQRQREERRHVAMVAGRLRRQLSLAGANPMPGTSTTPSGSDARGSSVWLTARADASTSPSTGSSRPAVAGLAASATLVTPRPIDTPPSDFALLIAVRLAT